MYTFRVGLVLLVYSINAGPISVNLSYTMVFARIEHGLSVDALRTVVFRLQ